MSTQAMPQERPVIGDGYGDGDGDGDGYGGGYGYGYTNDLFTRIAQTHLHIETLETRHRDSLDFHDVGVWCVRDALQAAFEAGVAEGHAQYRTAVRR